MRQKQTETAASEPWSVAGLLDALAPRGGRPAVIAFGDGAPAVWTCATLAENARNLAQGLREHSGGAAGPVALWAPNSPEWIIAALAVMAAGSVLVPIDDLADPAQFDAALQSSGARTILTTTHHRDAHTEALSAASARAILLDTPAWRALCRPALRPLPIPAADDPAVLTWTSGTTGAPKAFRLSHRNLAANVAALRDLAIVGTQDRALLPLPLHHAYPFVVGMLTTLTLGTTIVLPAGATGPSLTTALRDGAATAVIGVPRLYEALLAALDGRIAGGGRLLSLAWRWAQRAAILVYRTIRLCPGRLLFAPLRRRAAPELRLLVSGGARLERETEERLQALGWTVLSGYGLAETASLFCGNRPGSRRLGSVGRPLAGGEIRIADPDERGIGEIELRGPSVITSYLNNPAADRDAFTPDRWFRTGDLGFVDRDGFLFVTGRSKEVLVLGGGKKVAPEDLERAYGAAPEVIEIAVLVDNGAPVALVRPDTAKLRSRGWGSPRDGVRVILTQIAQDLPSYQHLAGFALTDRPLPRTRLGKYRRFLLPALYAAARTHRTRRTAPVLSAEDARLVHHPVGARVWALLRQRYPGQPLDPDLNLALDLNLDSFGWMELAMRIEDLVGVRLGESDIAGIETIRDLISRAVERAAVPGPQAASPVFADFDRWLAPPGPALRLLGFVLYHLNRLFMRGLFRLRAADLEKLPTGGSFVMTPNHVSYLDALAIAAALPWARIRRVYWAGDRRLLFSSPAMRLFSRAARVFPVDAHHPDAVLHSAKLVLAAGYATVWFPEGWRSPDGQLQRFLPGIGELLRQTEAQAVPVHIAGSFEALPRHRSIPRLRPITVRFGDAASLAALGAAGRGANEDERIADGLHQRVADLAAAAPAKGERLTLGRSRRHPRLP